MAHDDHRAVIEALATAQSEGVPVVLATVVETQGSMPRHAGTKLLMYDDGRTIGTVGGGAMEAQVIAEAREALRDGKTRLKTYTLNSLDAGDPGICGGTARIFIEPIGTMPILLVIGAGHVGVALAELGRWAGYRVILSDDRPGFATPEQVPGLDGYLTCSPSELTRHVSITPQTYIAAVTRGLLVDSQIIPALLATEAPYIGLIGSKRRWEITARTLLEQGVNAEQLARVRSPIGLELEAETPKEIALSILAEIIMLRRGGTGQPMQVTVHVRSASGPTT